MHIPAETIQKAITDYKNGLKLLYVYQTDGKIKEYEIQYYKMNSMETVFKSLFGSEFIDGIQNEVYSEYSKNI
jgi:hypothetical protein